MSNTKPQIREAIIVEGRYDKNTLSQVIDAPIIETRGFAVYNDATLVALLRRLAETRGIIVLTDSDGAGFQIRNYIKSALSTLSDGIVKHAYIPDVAGKERRKRTPSGAGTLGVEGMRPQVILQALHAAGATFNTAVHPNATAVEPDFPAPILLTKADMYALGLSGTDGAAERRDELLARLDLPRLLSSNALLDVLNALYTRDEICEMLQYNGGI